MANVKTVKSVIAEVNRLAGLTPRYMGESAPDDPAKVASKEYEAPPATSKNGGGITAGGVNTVAKNGGPDRGPGMPSKFSSGPATTKEPEEIMAGGGDKVASIGGAKSSADVQKFGNAPAADNNGGEVDGGGDSGEAKAGGAVPGDANIEDDGLRAEELELQYREARNARMYELVSKFS